MNEDDVAGLLTGAVDEKDIDLFAGNFIQRIDFDCDNLISRNDWLQFVTIYLSQAQETKHKKTAAPKPT